MKVSTTKDIATIGGLALGGLLAYQFVSKRLGLGGVGDIAGGLGETLGGTIIGIVGGLPKGIAEGLGARELGAGAYEHLVQTGHQQYLEDVIMGRRPPQTGGAWILQTLKQPGLPQMPYFLFGKPVQLGPETLQYYPGGELYGKLWGKLPSATQEALTKTYGVQYCREVWGAPGDIAALAGVNWTI